MKANIIRAFVVTGALAALCAGSGCVADRPSRNAVYNENQYLRKDFLIRPGSGGTDPGWFMNATVTASSVPNPFASMIATGVMNGGNYVNFAVTSDRLLMNNMIEPEQQTLNNGYAGNIGAQQTQDPETIDSWAITNVDLKYSVNLDGEKSNQYTENQELDWQLRQWVKVNFDKNDQSDFVPFGDMINEFFGKCATGDINATLDPSSFYVDEVNNYWQFGVQITVPVAFNSLPSVSLDTSTGQTTTALDPYCSDQFGFQGKMFQELGRQNVTFTVLYSFTRAPEDARTSYDGSNVGSTTAPALTYMPLVVPEKDNIQRKYQAFMTTIPAIDPSTGLWNARQLVNRHDPKAKQITYYFAPGFPQQYKSIFANPDQASCTDACVYSGGGGGVVDQTNALFKAAGAPTKMVVMDYDANLAAGQPPREFGDVRYNFLRWVSDLDTGAPWIGITQGNQDPRTGQTISSSIALYDNPWQDTLLARMDYYEQSIGSFCFASAGGTCAGANGTSVTVPAMCQDGDTLPLVPATIASNHNGSSTLFAKMQQYLNKPVATWGNLGPSDFIVQHDDNFFNAFFTILPYEIFNDPNANPFVFPADTSGNYSSSAMQMAAGEGEAQFHALMAQVDTGWPPYDVNAANGNQQASAYLAALQTGTLAHQNYKYLQHFAFPNRAADDISMYSLPGIFSKDARHCIKGTWETRAQYVTNLLKGYYAETLWHEFGHSLGMRHNFMGSVDRNNWPHYKDGAGRDHIGLYESSIMDYNIAADSTFWAGAANASGGGVNGQPGWAPYDQAAISWIYGNSSTTLDSLDSGKPTGVQGASISGQSGSALVAPGSASAGKTVTAANARWNDPFGYCPASGTTASGQPCTAGNEIQYLFCTDQHIKYTPFCRQFDFGTTPSEIIAEQIDDYEWQYLWRNFPQYHQFFDYTQYADGPSQFFTESRRFLSSWDFDWSQGELSDNFRKLGVVPPPNTPVAGFYDDLANAFNQDASMANQLYAATSQGIIQQASGERPYITVYDQYFGDTTQQGINDDKQFALQGFTALWPVNNYDQNQAAGTYIASFSFPGDTSYEGVAEGAVLSMVGGFAEFPYVVPLGVQQFAQATNSIDYQGGATGGRPEMKDWVNGYNFTRLDDFLNFFKNLAVTYSLTDANGNVICPNTPTPTAPDPVAACSYDPRTPTSIEDPLSTYHSDPFNQFIGPDFRRWIWVYLQDLNTWIAADRDRNVATYVMMYNYTSDVLYGEDDGNIGAPYAEELPLKYYLNYTTASSITP